MKTILRNPDPESAGGGGNDLAVETDGSDVYEAATEVDTTKETPGEVPETDMSQTPHTEEQVGKDAAEPGTEADAAANQAKIAAEGAEAAKTGVVQPTEDERIAKIAAAVVRAGNPNVGRQAAPAQEQEPELTPEQIKGLLNPVEVTAETLRGFGLENATPEQVGVVQQFANGIVRNAASVANLIIEQKLRENLAPYQPYVDFVAQQQAKQHIDSFYGKHGDLKKYEKFVQIAANQISSHKQDGSMKSAVEVYDEVASTVRGMLAEAGVTIASPSANPSAVVTGKKVVPKMASLATTGRSQGGQPSGEQNNPDADIYT